MYIKLIVRLTEAYHALCGRGTTKYCIDCGTFHRIGTSCEGAGPLI
jgi:hypothetical protein